VVVDGGYYGMEEVSGGSIVLNRQVTHAVVGYIYTGVVKSFILGFVIQQYNTQATFKALNRLSIRTTTSLGGKFGTDFYALKDIQKLQQGDINYLPALPLDGTETLPFLDKHPVKSARFRPYYKVLFWVFVVNCLLLGWVGAKPPEGSYLILGRVCTLYYFIHFLVVYPVLSKIEPTSELPKGFD
jgi:hypothetical protein